VASKLWADALEESCSTAAHHDYLFLGSETSTRAIAVFSMETMIIFFHFMKNIKAQNYCCSNAVGFYA